MKIAVAVVFATFCSTLLTAGLAAEGPLPCTQVPGYQQLDFWVGEWKVFDQEGNKVGDNTIQKVLKGCAITERWRSAAGNEGRSWFYYDYAAKQWKQVWVTEMATMTGGTKEKALVENFEDGGVRFQGTIRMPDGGSYLDRTTLTPQPDGNVRQHIEISADNGESWKTAFDARYVRRDD